MRDSNKLLLLEILDTGDSDLLELLGPKKGGGDVEVLLERHEKKKKKEKSNREREDMGDGSCAYDRRSIIATNGSRRFDWLGRRNIYIQGIVY